MFCDVNDKKVKNKYPKMKLKAGELVACLPAFRACWQRHMEAGSRQDVWIKIAFDSTIRMEEIMKDSAKDGRFTLSKDEAGELLQCAERLNLCNTALTRHYAGEGKKLFQTRTLKHHWALHACANSAFINPRLVWAYSGESFMHVAKVLMQSCCKAGLQRRV